MATANPSVSTSSGSLTTATEATSVLPAPIAVLTPRASGPAISGPRTMPVPILMYHRIGTAPSDAAYPGNYLVPSAFVAQLRYLVAQDYEAVTLQEVYDFWKGKGTLPPHPVVLSFDDGNPADFTVVAPLLDSLQWPGVLNLVAARGVETRMHPEQVRALIAAGWEVDSHTVAHLDLTTLTPTRLAYELTESRKRLRELFGVPVDFLCYPAGRYDEKVVAATRAAGYLGATTTEAGLAQPSQMFTLKRVRVSGDESLAEFALLLRAGR